MLKLFKDLKISYFVVAIIGAVFSIVIIGNFTHKSIGGLIGFIWVLACATFFNRIAAKRFNKIIEDAINTCNISKSLNRLYGLYKGRINNKCHLILAIYISNLLLHLGKYDLILKTLLPYDVEKVFQNRKEIVYKFYYYNVLTVCYSRLDKKDVALNFFNKSQEAFLSPYFNQKLKSEFELARKINHLSITNDGTKTEELLNLLQSALEESKSMLSKVSTRFSIVLTLIKLERTEETKEHIEFIAQNGGDTLYAKCAIKNDFTPEHTKKINLEDIDINPVKSKEYKIIICSIGLAVLMVATAVLMALTTQKTIYMNDYNGSATESIHTFDRNGNILSWKMESHGYYSSEFDLKMQYSLCSFYLVLNDYEGCNVTLSEKDGALDFSLFVDYNKTTDDVFEVLNDVSLTEKDFVESHKDQPYRICRYKEYLGTITVFDGIISGASNED